MGEGVTVVPRFILEGLSSPLVLLALLFPAAPPSDLGSSGGEKSMIQELPLLHSLTELQCPNYNSPPGMQGGGWSRKTTRNVPCEQTERKNPLIIRRDVFLFALDMPNCSVKNFSKAQRKVPLYLQLFKMINT